MLKRIEIENYRSCLRTSIDLHPQLSVLIGPNSSGKTNILQSIMLLNKMALGEQRRFDEETIPVTSRIKASFIPTRRTVIKLNASITSYSSESNNDVLINAAQKWTIDKQNGRIASFEFPLAVAGRLKHRRPVARGYHTFLYDASTFNLVRSLKRDKATSDIPKRAISDLDKVAAYCRGIRYYGASQFTNPGSSPVSFQIEQGVEYEGIRPRPFDRDRGGHTRILHDMYWGKKTESREYRHFFDIVGPAGIRLIDDLTFKEVPTSSTEYSVRVGGRVVVRSRKKVLVIPQFRIGRQRLSPNQLSEGTFKTLALIFHITNERSTALLIEEPEVCIHHGLLSSILELIKTHSQHKQTILSTHSDYVLDHVKPENVYRVSFDRSEGTIVRHIKETMTAKEFLALREYLEHDGNLGEYWREGGFGDRQ